MKTIHPYSHLHAAWLAVVALTGTSWLLFESRYHTLAWAGLAMTLIGLIKCRVVIRRFMHVDGHAPWPWRVAFDAWLLVVLGIVAAGYWFR